MSAESHGGELERLRQAVAQAAPKLILRLRGYFLDQGPNIRNIPIDWIAADGIKWVTGMKMLRDAEFISGGGEPGITYSRVPDYQISAAVLVYSMSDTRNASEPPVGTGQITDPERVSPKELRSLLGDIDQKTLKRRMSGKEIPVIQETSKSYWASASWLESQRKKGAK